MGYVKWSHETLNHFCGDVFKAFGFTEEESNQIKDVLLTADLYGIESHGMQRMVRYHKGIEKGTIHPQAKPEIVFETPISADKIHIPPGLCCLHLLKPRKCFLLYLRLTDLMPEKEKQQQKAAIPQGTGSEDDFS